MTAIFIVSSQRNIFEIVQQERVYGNDPLEAATPVYHPLSMHSTYPTWLKALAILTVVMLLGGFIFGAIWPRSIATIGVPIGFTLWWIVAKAAGFRGRRVHDTR